MNLRSRISAGLLGSPRCRVTAGFFCAQPEENKSKDGGGKRRKKQRHWTRVDRDNRDLLDILTLVAQADL